MPDGIRFVRHSLTYSIGTVAIGCGFQMRHEQLAISSDSIDEVARRLGETLGTSVESRDSSHRGEYCLLRQGDGEIIVYYNRDPMLRFPDPPDEQYFEPGFEEYEVLIALDLNNEDFSRARYVVREVFPDAVVIREANGGA